MSGQNYSAAAILKGSDVVKSLNEAIKAELGGMKAEFDKMKAKLEVTNAEFEEIKTESGVSETWVAPKLAILRAGERPDDLAYEKGVVKRFADIGLNTEVYAFPEAVSQEDFMAALQKVNADPDIHGILLFRPLPVQIDDKLAADIIEPAKDVDGISPLNMAKVFTGDQSGFAPCTAAAVVAILDHAGIGLRGKRVTIVGRSLVVGKPLSMLLLGRDATVTLCHSKTLDLPGVCREADILVACAGQRKMLGADCVKPSAIVIDVGINVDEDGNLCGDVDFEAVLPLASAITPVPGGVGSVTTSVLAQHLIWAAKGLSDTVWI